MGDGTSDQDQTAPGGWVNDGNDNGTKSSIAAEVDLIRAQIRSLPLEVVLAKDANMSVEQLEELLSMDAGALVLNREALEKVRELARKVNQENPEPEKTQAEKEEAKKEKERGEEQIMEVLSAVVETVVSVTQPVLAAAVLPKGMEKNSGELMAALDGVRAWGGSIAKMASEAHLCTPDIASGIVAAAKPPAAKGQGQPAAAVPARAPIA